MGLISGLLKALTGGQIQRGIETFYENKEQQAIRDALQKQSSLSQFSAEFERPKTSSFDRFIDGLNRLPRPVMALGVIALFISAMIDPIWFSSRMQGIALVPEPLWWLLGAIVSFYFGSRYQLKGQEFRKSQLASIELTEKIEDNLKRLQGLDAAPDEVPKQVTALKQYENAAYEDWRTKKLLAATK